MIRMVEIDISEELLEAILQGVVIEPQHLNKKHKVEYEEIVGFAPVPGKDLIAVHRKAIFRKFDGFQWSSQELKSQNIPNYVFEDMRKSLFSGDMGKQATYGGYMNGLNKPDEYLGQILSNSFIKAEQEAGELYSGAVTPLHLLKTAEAFYFSEIGRAHV